MNKKNELHFLHKGFILTVQYLAPIYKCRPPSLSELTLMIFNTGLTHLNPIEATISAHNLWAIGLLFGGVFISELERLDKPYSTVKY